MERKKRGRPRAEKPKDAMLRVRMDAQMDAAIRAEAKRQGIKVAEFVRCAIVAALPSD